MMMITKMMKIGQMELGGLTTASGKAIAEVGNVCKYTHFKLTCTVGRHKEKGKTIEEKRQVINGTESGSKPMWPGP
jgi:hypothetical protein